MVIPRTNVPSGTRWNSVRLRLPARANVGFSERETRKFAFRFFYIKVGWEFNEPSWFYGKVEG